MDDLETAAREALVRAKRVVKGGSALGRSFDPPITGQAVRQWAKAPAERVLDIERITGVTRYELRPDIYGTENKEAAE